MPTFSFEIRDAFDGVDGFDGVTLIGPPLEPVDGLAVGDTLLVPATDGQAAICRCLGFPLLNLGPDRGGWVRVAVSTVSIDAVAIGGVATKGV